jgi:uncharacterized PurR-regulated membrane protein YhhQ (DUF165 family)
MKLAVVFIVVAGLLDTAANYLAAHYLVPIGPFLVPGGTFLFALSFTIYDLLRRYWGLGATVAAIGLGFAVSLGYSAAFGGGVGRIAIAGLVALVCSGSCDLMVQSLAIRWPLWSYIAVDNIASLLVDTCVFAFVAFAPLPLSVKVQIILGQYLVKLAMTGVSIPLVYGARTWTGRYVAA